MDGRTNEKANQAAACLPELFLFIFRNENVKVRGKIISCAQNGRFNDFSLYILVRGIKHISHH